MSIDSKRRRADGLVLLYTPGRSNERGYRGELSSVKVDKRGPPREFKERPAPRRSPDGTFKRRKSNQL